MFNYLMAIFLILLVACIIQNPEPLDSNAYPALFPEIPIAGDSTKQDLSTLAFTAVDRQCGSCHHSNRSTNMSALAVFNLKDSCWYCALTPEEGESLKGRISGPSFSEEERSAIVGLIAHLSQENENTTN